MESGKPIREVLQQIAFECSQSGATKWQALKVIKELEGFEGAEQQLKKKAAEALEKLNPEAAKTLLSFEKLRVYTSAEKLEPFDRGNIIKSLLKETGISRHVAEKIGSEVEGKIKDLKIEYLNAQLIREMVNVKLLEYGHEPTHSEYARIGMPVFEVKKKLSEGIFENPEILAEYNWLSAIPRKARDLHFESFIHIFHPEDFSTKVGATSGFFAASAEETALGAKELDALSSCPSTIKALNFGLAAGGKIPKKKMQEEAERLGKIFSITGKKRFAEVALFSDFEWQGLSQKKNLAVQLGNALLKSKNAGLGFCACVDSKYQLKLLDKKSLPERLLIANNSRGKATQYDFGLVLGAHSCMVQNAGINLPKMAQASGQDEAAFFETLKDALNAINSAAEAKTQILGTKNYFPKSMLEEPAKAVCLAGLLGASSMLGLGSEGKIAEKIISAVQKEGFSLLEMRDEKILRKFGIIEDRWEAQKMLLGISSKQRKNYAFAYLASTMKEAENLLAECPLIELIASHDAHSAQ